jgi:hypothetical protein
MSMIFALYIISNCRHLFSLFFKNFKVEFVIKSVKWGAHTSAKTTILLGNMTSIEEMREKLQTFCIDQSKLLQYEKS